MDNANALPGGAVEPAYARFLPRLRALIIDAIILMLMVFGVLMVAVAVRSENVARVLGFAVVAAYLLYEPLLVSFTGSTIGHRRANLRVVDDRTGGNVSFPKAVARAVIKGLLGWISFISMLVTRRSQAVHDLLTRSTVQIRDLAAADPRVYARERREFGNPAMPSAGRRAAVILLYAIVSAAVFFALLIVVVQAGMISNACIQVDRCSTRDNLTSSAIVFGWVAVCLVWLGLGWRGRLYGCRAA